MKVNLSNEIMTIEDGTYKSRITEITGYNNNENILIKIQLDDGNVFVKFYATDDFVKFGWSDVLRALNTDDTDDLIGKVIQFDVTNGVSQKTGNAFSNIRRIKLLSEKEHKRK